jgi:predicted ArsR family transcriptional regulator
MMGVGFDIEALPGEHRLVTRTCPFGATADNHPDIVCRLDQGLVTGLLETTSQTPLAIVTPHGGEGDACLTEI